MKELLIRGQRIKFDRPYIMGVLNVTPDSFSDGGQYPTTEKAYAHAIEMLEQGADIIDIGGESTRPGAKKVSLQEELDRVIPVLEKIKQNVACRVSIDSSKAEVMQYAISAGADMINDVNALQAEGAIDIVAKSKIAVCLMHMQGQPDNMQVKPNYASILNDINSFLKQRIAQCVNAGIEKTRLLIDPGIGFGKSLTHNLTLLKHCHTFQSLDCPILLGLSRKSLLGELLNVSVTERLQGSITLAVLAVQNGADIIRVHDVKETKQAMIIVDAVNKS